MAGSASPPFPVYGLIAAAGSGSRVGGSIPKQYLELGGQSVISRSVQALLQLPAMQALVVSIAAQDRWWSAQSIAAHAAVSTVTGGASRGESVLAGLRYLLGIADPGSWVLVHDAARPLVRVSDILHLMHSVAEAEACGGILATAVTDTIKQANRSGSEQPLRIENTPRRDLLWQAQTPQLFPLKRLHDAIVEAMELGLALTDEASALEAQGLSPLLVPGHADNIKITHAADLATAELLLARQH